MSSWSFRFLSAALRNHLRPLAAHNSPQIQKRLFRETTRISSPRNNPGVDAWNEYRARYPTATAPQLRQFPGRSTRQEPRIEEESPSEQYYEQYGREEPEYRSPERPWWLRTRTMVFIGISGALGVYYFRHIEEVPISGRRRFIDVSPNVEQILARTAYSQIMQEFRGKILPPNHPYSRFVGRVAERIIRVAGMDDLKWEVHVIDSPQRNAFVLPGGKIFVFVGILPIVQNEDGMAAVLGHEVAHQVARHSAEKLSYTKGLLMLQFLLSLIIDPRIVFDQTISEYGILRPFSRIAETEADYIGLKLMATACFDPRAALTMWERMKLVDGDRVAPEYMSTHPGHDTRIKKIEQWLPEAIQIRANSNCQQVAPLIEMFNRRLWSTW